MTPSNQESWIDSFDYEALALELTLTGIKPVTPQEAKNMVIQIVMHSKEFERPMDMDKRVETLSRYLGEIVRNGNIHPPQQTKVVTKKKMDDGSIKIVTRYDRRQLKKEKPEEPTRIVTPLHKRKNPYGQKRLRINSDRGTTAQGNHSNG